jgi:hypothetical protein
LAKKADTLNAAGLTFKPIQDGFCFIKEAANILSAKSDRLSEMSTMGLKITPAARNLWAIFLAGFPGWFGSDTSALHFSNAAAYGRVFLPKGRKTVKKE